MIYKNPKVFTAPLGFLCKLWYNYKQHLLIYTAQTLEEINLPPALKWIAVLGAGMGCAFYKLGTSFRSALYYAQK